MRRTLPAASGFVLPVVLGIILLAAFIAVQATTELGGTTLLATQRHLHQRAFEAAESGVVTVLDQLGSGAEPAAVQSLRPNATSSESISVKTAIVARLALPDGFSADRVLETRYEIHSTGLGVRGSEVTIVQGVRQLRAVSAP